MTNIRSAVTIRRRREDVFDFVTTPSNWPRWHPSSIRVSGDAEHPLAAGERCVEEYVVAGRRGSAEWMVAGCERPSTWVIEAHPPGGGQARITYHLFAVDEGTRFTRTLEYAMPTPLLALLDALVLRRRIEHESATAVDNLRWVLETTGTVTTSTAS